VTLQYSDKRVNTPSNLITGELTSGVHVFGAMKALSVPHWLAIPKNARIENISPDSEIEGYFAQPSAPANVHVLFEGGLSYQTYPGGNLPKVPLAQSIWFTTPSGAAIFNAGFTTWACDLSDACVYPSITSSSQSVLQKTTLTILSLWSQKVIGPKLEKGEEKYLVTKTNPLLIRPARKHGIAITSQSHNSTDTKTANAIIHTIAPSTKSPSNNSPKQQHSSQTNNVTPKINANNGETTTAVDTSTAGFQ
jgi:hypothetical protein